MEEKITPHFSMKEFERSETAEKCGIDNTIPEALKPRIKALCERVLEPVRAQFGPIRITSGYRCAALNAAIKGAKNSQHTRGEAADIVCDEVKSEKRKVKSASLREVFTWMMDNLQFDQLILEPQWIHVSYREGKNRQMVIQQ